VSITARAIDAHGLIATDRMPRSHLLCEFEKPRAAFEPMGNQNRGLFVTSFHLDERRKSRKRGLLQPARPDRGLSEHDRWWRSVVRGRTPARSRRTACLLTKHYRRYQRNCRQLPSMAAAERAAKSRLVSRRIVDADLGLTLHLERRRIKESHCTPELGTSHLYGQAGSGSRSEILGDSDLVTKLFILRLAHKPSCRICLDRGDSPNRPRWAFLNLPRYPGAGTVKESQFPPLTCLFTV